MGVRTAVLTTMRTASDPVATSPPREDHCACWLASRSGVHAEPRASHASAATRRTVVWLNRIRAIAPFGCAVGIDMLGEYPALEGITAKRRRDGPEKVRKEVY